MDSSSVVVPTASGQGAEEGSPGFTPETSELCRASHMPDCPFPFIFIFDLRGEFLQRAYDFTDLFLRIVE